MMREILLEVNGSSFMEGNFSLDEILEKYRIDSQIVYNRPENIVLITIYIPVIFTALILNILVIAVFIKYRSFRTVTNCFLMNLSIADLFVTLICMPAALGSVIHADWLFGEFICKITHYLQGVAVSSSVFTLTAMTIDRYLAIRHPLKRKTLASKKLTTKVIMVLWSVSILIFAPILFVRKTDGYRLLTYDFVFCLEVWPNSSSQRIFGVVIFTTVYAFPGLIIIIAYSLMGCTLRRKQLLPEIKNTCICLPYSQQSSASTIRTPQVYTLATMNLIKERRKVARTLMILAMVFACCWLPSSVLSLLLDLRAPMAKDEMDPQNEYIYEKLHQYFILLGHLNSLLNPFLYTLFTKTFRNHVKEWLKGLKVCCHHH